MTQNVRLPAGPIAADSQDGGQGAPGIYTCPQCAAPLAEKPDVSPLSDVKCTFCSSWFNIHSSR